MRAEFDTAGVLSEVVPALEALFDALESIGTRVAREFAARSTAPPEQLNGLDPVLVQTLLAHGDLAAGIGIVLDPSAVSGRERWLQWFWHTGDRPPERLRADLDPDSVDFYDYTTAAWYLEPSESRRRAVVGPYVDYICSTEYVFTLAAPIVSGDRWIGIAAADVRVSRIEELVLPKLRRFGVPVVLTNGGGRVIASNSARLPAGAIVSAGGPPASRDLPWTLDVAAPHKSFPESAS